MRSEATIFQNGKDESLRSITGQGSNGNTHEEFMVGGVGGVWWCVCECGQVVVCAYVGSFVWHFPRTESEKAHP
jgi:hypothetical protein